MIESLAMKQIAETIGADYCNDCVNIATISTDTRSIGRDDIFVAIKGNNFDGHDFVEQAFAKQAIAAIVDKQYNSSANHKNLLRVDDTVIAYGQVAALNRKRFKGKLIALTGSSGKTTTKEILTTIFTQSFATHSSTKNYNNEIGVAKSLLEINASHEIAVLEFGARKIGDIEWLTTISQPDIGLIINIGSAHLDTFGTIEGVLKAKSELFRYLPKGSIAIVNGDDELAEHIMKYSHCSSPCYSYSTHNVKTNCYATNVRMDEYSSSFVLHLSLPSMRTSSLVTMSLVGQHNISNACASALGAAVAGCTMEQIVVGLEAVEPVEGRYKKVSINDKLTIIDDSYNANPNSVKVAIDSLCLSVDKTPIMMFGDMLELGKDSQQLHSEIGEYAAKKGVCMFFGYGTLASHSVRSFAKHKPGMAFSFCTLDDLVRQLLSILELSNTKVQLLVKGSRSMKMESAIIKLQGT